MLLIFLLPPFNGVTEVKMSENAHEMMKMTTQKITNRMNSEYKEE